MTYTIMRKISLAIVFFLLAIFSYSNETVDSLENVLKSATGIHKAEVLNVLSKEYSKKNHEKSRQYADEALQISIDENSDENKARAYYNIGEIYRLQNDYKQSLKNNQEALNIFKHIENQNGEADCFVNFGLIYDKKGEYDKALDFYKKALEIRIKIEDLKGQSVCYNNIGNIYKNKGKYDDAINSFTKAKKIKDLIHDEKGAGISMYNIGNIHFISTDYEKALSNYQAALKIFEDIDFKSGIASCYSSFGMIYENWNENKKAIEYYEKALDIEKEVGNNYGIADGYNNIGNAYSQDSNFVKALDYYKESLSLRQKIGFKQGIASSLSNIGISYSNLGDYEEANKYLKEALIIVKEINNPYELVNIYNAIGKNYLKINEYRQALEMFNKSLVVAKETDLKMMYPTNYLDISNTYNLIGNYKMAYESHKNYFESWELIYNDEKNRILADMQTKYETEKKEQQIELLNKDKEIDAERIKQQKIIIYVFIIGLMLIIVFAILIYRQYQQKKKANRELEIKNALITHQKQEITDSIHYAERIQRAVLPSDNFISEYLSNYFVLFKPKDIVSGDFYWMTVKNDTIIIAAVDCTGHGVPGAFMSMLGVSFLNETVNDKAVLNANEILNEVRKSVIKSLQQTGKEGEAKDGMDMAICTIDMKNKKLEFAGANNPLYIIRNLENSKFNDIVDQFTNVQIYEPEKLAFIEIKPDKMPVAIHIKMNSFTNNIIDLQDGDKIYIFSDGFADQFGGPKGKKFKYKQFKDLLISNSNVPMLTQKEILNKSIEDWKSYKNIEGVNYEQVDDILIIGIEV
jgi:tetratricopeptide (TPR) repeat protein